MHFLDDRERRRLHDVQAEGLRSYRREGMAERIPNVLTLKSSLPLIALLVLEPEAACAIAALLQADVTDAFRLIEAYLEPAGSLTLCCPPGRLCFGVKSILRPESAVEYRRSTP